jgi:hypothetical protein
VQEKIKPSGRGAAGSTSQNPISKGKEKDSVLSFLMAFKL